VTAFGHILIVCIVALACADFAGASAVHLPGEVEQADPISGLHWQRVLDPKRPAAPPRLTLMRGSSAASSRPREQRRPVMCVRAGDHVLLRDAKPSFSRFSLEATALENGACGAHVRARVAVTGALLEMTVLEAGTGVFSGKAAAWR
jgi:hypothetical protein